MLNRRPKKSETSSTESGLGLSRSFYFRQVRPILIKYFPKLKYSAALIGYGSEVLGFDTPISRDHAWGPRVLLFVRKDDYIYKNKINTILSKELPYSFQGYSTNFSKPDKFGVRELVTIKMGPINHRVEVFTLQQFLRLRLGIAFKRKLRSQDWLNMPQQRLLEITSGAVFHDGLNELHAIRRQLSYYPRNVWLYILASQWQKISQKEAFVGRAGDVGDEIGSQLIAAFITKELMQLCFLIERKYIPYSKWFGSAFKRLRCSKKLLPVFREILASRTWRDREDNLSQAYHIIAQMHNSLQITKKLPIRTTRYYNRPYYVIHADRFAQAIRAKIRDRQFKRLELVGSVDQYVDISVNIELLDWLTIIQNRK